MLKRPGQPRDLDGAVVTPGLADTHFHVSSWSKKLPAAGERFDALLAALGLRAPVAALDDLPYFAIERDPLEVARLVVEAGGLCHVGHVDRAFGDYCFIESELVHDLAECPYVSAIELIDHSCRERFRDGLAIAHISSSDSHSLEEMGRRTATLEMRELSFEGLKAAFDAARGR